MAQEAIKVKGPTVLANSTSGTLAPTIMDSAGKMAIVQSYTLADLSLKVQFGSAPTAGGTISVYRRDLSIDGANSAPTPTGNYSHTFIGSFKTVADTAVNYLPLDGVPISTNCELFVKNDTDATMSTDWNLKATPWTYGPAP